MPRGRKALAGTYEAREKIDTIVDGIQNIENISQNAKDRAIKAVRFGLGIKDSELEQSTRVKDIEKSEPEEVIKQSKEALNIIEEVEGDEYFNPEDYEEVQY